MDISVVIPCYNCEDTITETLESIFNQSVKPKEIITINDGSKDNTEKILKQYSDRVIIKSQQNSGVSSTRNFGGLIAKSEWIAFCDSDDIWHPNKLEICLNVMKTLKDTVFLFHDFRIRREDLILSENSTESKQYTLFPIFRNRRITMSDIFKNHFNIEIRKLDKKNIEVPVYSGNALYWLMFGNFIQPSTVIIKKEVFISSSGFDDEFIHAEDTEYFLRLSKKFDYTYIDRPLLTYFVRPQSLLSTSLLPTIINGTRALVKHCVEDKKIYHRYTSRINKAVANKYARLAYFYLTELNKKEAQTNALEAVKYYPLVSMAYFVLLIGWLPLGMTRILKKLKSKYFSSYN